MYKLIVCSVHVTNIEAFICCLLSLITLLFFLRSSNLFRSLPYSVRVGAAKQHKTGSRFHSKKCVDSTFDLFINNNKVQLNYLQCIFFSSKKAVSIWLHSSVDLFYASGTTHELISFRCFYA